MTAPDGYDPNYEPEAADMPAFDHAFALGGLACICALRLAENPFADNNQRQAWWGGWMAAAEDLKEVN